VVDDRVLVGAPIWLKPLKFAVSFVLFGTTLAWMISLLGRRRRLGNGLGNVVVVTGVIEMVIIVGQVVRGRQSHFNTTTVLDGVLWDHHGLGDRAAVGGHGDRGGVAAAGADRGSGAGPGHPARLVVALLGMAVAFFMGVPRPAQQDALALGQTTLSGAHAVGVPDGGPGVPVTGWSTTGGDLRVPHFIGLHALQGVPLLALALGAFSVRGGRWQRLRDEHVRMGLVAVVAGAWLCLTALLTWQALRGQPLLAPDGPTLAVLGALLLATTIGVVVVLRTGSRRHISTS